MCPRRKPSAPLPVFLHWSRSHALLSDNEVLQDDLRFPTLSRSSFAPRWRSGITRFRSRPRHRRITRSCAFRSDGIDLSDFLPLSSHRALDAGNRREVDGACPSEVAKSAVGMLTSIPVEQVYAVSVVHDPEVEYQSVCYGESEVPTTFLQESPEERMADTGHIDPDVLLRTDGDIQGRPIEAVEGPGEADLEPAAMGQELPHPLELLGLGGGLRRSIRSTHAASPTFHRRLRGTNSMPDDQNGTATHDMTDQWPRSDSLQDDRANRGLSISRNGRHEERGGAVHLKVRSDHGQGWPLHGSSPRGRGLSARWCW